MNNNKYRTVKQTAETLWVSENTIRNWLREGKLHTHIIDWIKHIDLEELLQVVDNWQPSKELLSQVKDKTGAKGNRATSMADGETPKKLPTVAGDEDIQDNSSSNVGDEISNFSKNCSRYFSKLSGSYIRWFIIHMGVALGILTILAYDNYDKFKTDKSSAIAIIGTWTIVNNRRSDHLKKLAEINEKIDTELEWQKSKRIQIYNLELKIKNSIKTVRGYIKEKEQIQSDMIQNSQITKPPLP